MSKANITINASTQKIKIGHSRQQQSFPIVTTKKIQLPAFSETMVPLNVKSPFVSALIEGSPSLPDGICLMEGIVSASDNKCNAIFANFSHLPVTVPAYSSVANIHSGPVSVFPLEACLANTPSRPKTPVSVDHLRKINLDHLPSQYQAQYRSLLHKYSDVFSTSDLDIGHSKSCLLYTSPSPRD